MNWTLRWLPRLRWKLGRWDSFAVLWLLFAAVVAVFVFDDFGETFDEDKHVTYGDMIQYIENSIDVIIQAGRQDGKRGITEFYLPGATEIGISP